MLLLQFDCTDNRLLIAVAAAAATAAAYQGAVDDADADR